MTWKRTKGVPLDALRVQLRALPSPEPLAELLPRILASRAAGVQVVLPPGEATSTPLRHLRYAAAVVAVAGVGWLTFATLTGRAERSGGRPAWRLDGTPFGPSSAFGQERAVHDMRPRYSLVTTLEPQNVQEGRWTYELRWITDGVFTSSRGQRMVVLTPGSYGEKPMWLITASADTGDTVFVDRDLLRPVRHVQYGRRFSLIQEFSRDSVVERLRVAPPRERSFQGSAVLPGLALSPLLVSWSPSLEALVQALPLEPGWRGSVYGVNWVSMTHRLPAFVPLDLRVTGTEQITVPAGTFDCWKLEVREGTENSFIWVSKDRRWLVMKQHAWSGDSGDWLSEARLVSADTSVAPAP